MHIRLFRPTDLEALKELTVAAFDGVSIDHNIEKRFGVLRGGDWRWRKGRHVADDAAANPQGVFVAEEDGRVVGYVSTRLDPGAGIGTIPNLAVAEDRRGGGVGRRLIEHALEYFRANGMELARIETLDQNPVGQHLYPSCGFQEVARQVHYAMRL